MSGWNINIDISHLRVFRKPSFFTETESGYVAHGGDIQVLEVTIQGCFVLLL